MRLNRVSSRKSFLIASSLSALSLAVLSNPAAAQDAPAAETAATQEDDSIIVTGSRIARPEFAAPNPIQTFDSETIELSGKTDVVNILVDSPALLGSATTSDTSGSNYGSALTVGGTYLNLRNLGTQRTLVLVDGRRHVAGLPSSAAVDINTIPLDLIERVDVLTGGASAVYGADGVSGVVNFVMKRDFEGFRARGQVGISQRGDSGNQYIGLTAGKNFADGRGNVTLAYEYATSDRFSQTQRLGYGRAGPRYRFVANQADPFDADPTTPDFLPLTGLRWADTSPGGAFDLDYDFVPDFTGEGKVYVPAPMSVTSRSPSVATRPCRKSTSATPTRRTSVTSPTCWAALKSALRCACSPTRNMRGPRRKPIRSRSMTCTSRFMATTTS